LATEALVKAEKFETMKILIGLFQDKNDATEVYRKRLHDITSLTEVGPFFSKEQALAWMEELRSHIGNSEVVLLPTEHRSQLKWYGFTFEE